LEPQFFAEMLQLLNISPADYGEQNDKQKWREQHQMLEFMFRSKTRDQ